MNSKLMSLLSLCRKAGKLVTGFDEVRQAIWCSEAKLIILSCDLSPKRAEDIEYTAGSVSPAVKVVRSSHTMDELMQVLGRRTGIIAVTERGLADSVEAACSQTREGADIL